jgi:hypothetical protein
MIMFFVGNLHVQTKFGTFTVYDFVILGLAVLLYSIYIVVTFINARQLAAIERKE